MGKKEIETINERICKLIKQGNTVFSHAAGRIGVIVSARREFVIVKTVKGMGSTTFSSGDPVKLIRGSYNEQWDYIVENITR